MLKKDIKTCVQLVNVYESKGEKKILYYYASQFYPEELLYFVEIRRKEFSVLRLLHPSKLLSTFYCKQNIFKCFKNIVNAYKKHCNVQDFATLTYVVSYVPYPSCTSYASFCVL